MPTEEKKLAEKKERQAVKKKAISASWFDPALLPAAVVSPPRAPALVTCMSEC